MTPTFTLYDAKELFRITAVQLDKAKLTLFSVMKNEMAFLPSWLKYHRSISFDQVLIWDDASDDGTLIYLKDQPDVVVLQSKFGFGDDIVFFGNPKKKSGALAFIPQLLCRTSSLMEHTLDTSTQMNFYCCRQEFLQCLISSPD